MSVSPTAPERAAASQATPRGRGGPSALPTWSPWTAPLALVLGLMLAALGGLLIDIPALLFGVHVGSGRLPPGLQIADTFVQDVGFVAAAVLIAGWGGRQARAWQFGLRATPWRRAVVGVLALYAAFVAFSAVWAVALNVHAKEKVLDQLGANRNAALLLGAAALTTVVAPICEEFLFRGFIFTALRNWSGPWVAAVLTGVLFGAVHAQSAPVALLVPLGALGFGLCILYWRTGSLYPCIAAHCINNSLAFGTLEGWSWQIPVLVVCALSAVGVLGLGLRRSGLLALPVSPATAPATS